MHGPAPVSLEAAGDGGGWRRALTMLHLAAAAALLAWMPGLAMTVAALALLALGGWTLRALARAPRAALAWDGQGWRHGGRPVQPRAALDLGGWMLLRLDPADDAGGRVAWVPLSPAAAGAAWPALRAALFASAAAGRAPVALAPAGPTAP